MTEEELTKIKLRHLEANTKAYNENKDLIGLYEEYTKKITGLFDFLMKKRNDFLYTIVFDILVDVGYFSANHTFDSDKDNFKELLIKPGISIINGEGLCRNVAFFYEDVFKSIYNYPLKLCCLDENGIICDDTNTYGNHLINVTKYHNNIHCFDIMNHCVFKPISSKKLRGLWINNNLTYKPFGDLLLKLTTDLKLDDNLYDEVLRKQYFLETAAMQETILKNEYEKMVSEANKFITDHKVIFKSFMIQNEELTHEIKKKMLSL